MADQDKLKRAQPESVGVHSQDITAFLKDLAKSNLELNSFMLYRSGNIIAEGYWWPYRRELPHTLHSASKSIFSMAVGLAIDEGYFKLDSTVASFFPDRIPQDASPYLHAMTVEDLLTQTSGHAQGASGGEFRRIKTSWVDEFFRIPVEHEPGTLFRYSSTPGIILGALISKTTGQTVRDFLEPRVFRPLGIKNLTWDIGPENINPGGNGVSCLTEDFLKFAILHLQKGQWNGKQILPKDWVEAATSQKRGNKYGYHWWADDQGFYAVGMFGQFAFVYPEYDAIVVTTAAVSRMATELREVILRHIPILFKDSTPLDENTAAAKALEEHLNSLELLDPLPASTPIPPAASLISKERFVTAPNADEIISFTLDFQDNSNIFTFHLQDQKGFHRVQAGLGMWFESQTNIFGPELHHGYDPAEVRVVAGGHWTESNTFEITLQYIETAFRDTFTITFHKDNTIATLDRSVNVSNGATKRPTIIGAILIKGDELKDLKLEDYVTPAETRFSTSSNTIGELLDHPKTRAVLDAEIPTILYNPRLDKARKYTFDAIYRHIEGLSLEDLVRIDGKLAEIKE